MKLSVIILNYNVRYFLELCIKSVEIAIKDIEAEIIVVDNNSPDDSCEMVKERFPNVTLIENKENSGFSKGNNIGVKQARGEYLCILNPDTVVAEDTFTKILAFADSKSDCGIVGCQLIDGTGAFLPESKRQVPTPKVAFQKLLGNSKNYYTHNLNPKDIGKTEILVGAFMLVKRSVYNEVGGLDEDYFMYGEDIDLSYKILKAGYFNYYFGETSVIHFKGESTLKDKTYAKRFYGAMAIFYKKHFANNPILTNLVNYSLKLVSLRGRKLKSSKFEVNKSLVVSDSIEKRLNSKLTRPITFTSNLKDIPNHAMVVFDADFLDFGTIIDFMKRNGESNKNAFRILLKSSNFILGSDSSTGRGDVMHY